MKLQLSETIKALRKRDARTQEAVADALGISPQAVSRWESGAAYPDMELIPAIANYFGITIDELFGYECERDQKVGQIIAQVNACGIPGARNEQELDQAIAILREALAQFPKNERLLIELAQVLSDAGWWRHSEYLYYDEKGYIRHDYDRHKTNEYWKESVKICEYLADNAVDHSIVNRATCLAVMLYRNFGEYEKAIAYANRMPTVEHSRELLLCAAADGKEEARYIGDALLKMACKFADQIVYGLIVKLDHFQSDLPIQKVKGAIALFDLVCEDGNLGQYHADVIELYLYLSRLEWERGYHDDAFVSLDRALEHARALEALYSAQEERCLSAALVSFVPIDLAPGVASRLTHGLPDCWPVWCNPDYTQVEQEIKSDPRWEEWVKKTQQ